MAVLKKIKASTLMETLVATVLIVIIFMISSLLMNSLFSNSIKSRNNKAKVQLQQLSYTYVHQPMTLPYYEQIGDWDYSIVQDVANKSLVRLKAENTSLKSVYTQILINETSD